MTNYNKMPQVVCKMRSIKCENPWHVQNCKRVLSFSDLNII